MWPFFLKPRCSTLIFKSKTENFYHPWLNWMRQTRVFVQNILVITCMERHKRGKMPLRIIMTVTDIWGSLTLISGCKHEIDSLYSIGDYIYAIRGSTSPQRFSLNTNRWQRIRLFYIDGTCSNTICGKASVVSPDNSCLFLLQGQRKKKLILKTGLRAGAWIVVLIPRGMKGNVRH